MADPAAYYRRNRLAVIGTGAVVIAAAFAYLQLRRTPSAGALGAAAAPASSGTSDLSAYTAGAGAASSGFDTGAALGQGALGLAGSVVASQAGVASTLAQSQAQVASGATADFAAALGAAMGALGNLSASAPAASQLPALQVDPGNPPPGAMPATTVGTCAALATQIAAAATSVATMQRYVNTYLAIPLARRTATQKAALATDQATLARDQATLASLRARAAAAGC